MVVQWLSNTDKDRGSVNSGWNEGGGIDIGVCAGGVQRREGEGSLVFEQSIAHGHKYKVFEILYLPL